MDSHCSRHSPYQPSAGQVYLDYSRLERRDDGIDRRFRALDLSSRHLSALELQEHHNREARLRQQENDRWAKIERSHPVEKGASTALHWCNCPPGKCPSGKRPPGKASNGKENTNRQLSGEVPQHSQPKPKPPPPYVEDEDPGQRRRLGTRRSERGYPDNEIAKKMRVARMGLSGRQSHDVAAVQQTTIPIPIPGPTNHHSPRICVPKLTPAPQTAQLILNQSKAHQQQTEPSACGQRVRESTNDSLLEAQVSMEADQRKLAQQKREQQRVQLPAAKPGHLYPGPTRVSGILPPNYMVNDGDTKSSIASELAHTVHLKSQMASQEAYRKYKEGTDRKEQEDEQRKAASSGPTFEALTTEYVRQLKQRIRTGKDVESFRAKLQLPRKDPEDAYKKAGLWCGEPFWSRYDKNHPTARQSDGTSNTPSQDSASIQPLMAKPDRPIGADESARHTGLPRREVSFELPPKKDLGAAVEAIDKVSGDLLESPKSASGPNETPCLEPSTVSISRKGKGCIANAARLPPVTAADASVKAPRRDVAILPIADAYLHDIIAELEKRGERVEGAAEAEAAAEAAVEKVDIELEWEEIDDCLGDGLGDDGLGYDGFGDDGFGDDGLGDDGLGDDEWSYVEQELLNNMETVHSSSSDVEWASNVTSWW